MSKKEIIFIAIALFWLAAGFYLFKKTRTTADDRFISYTADTRTEQIRLYWKDEQGKDFRNIGNLLTWTGQHQVTLSFAMNGGMYQPDFSPVGLLIAESVLLHPADTGNGNFYLKPNGVFFVRPDGSAGICATQDISRAGNMAYATQSGPMLLQDGQINPSFKQDSANLQVRNGVGILPGGKVLFVLSKKAISFYDFAAYFKTMDCKDALYLDGQISRAYQPAQQWEQKDGDLGVIIGVYPKTKP